MKKCPKCGGYRFITTSHITQDWLVDENGNFLGVLTDCLEVTHSADDDDLWTCSTCGYNNAGSEFNIIEGNRKMVFPLPCHNGK